MSSYSRTIRLMYNFNHSRVSYKHVNSVSRPDAYPGCFCPGMSGSIDAPESTVTLLPRMQNDHPFICASFRSLQTPPADAVHPFSTDSCPDFSKSWLVLVGAEDRVHRRLHAETRTELQLSTRFISMWLLCLLKLIYSCCPIQFEPCGILPRVGAAFRSRLVVRA